MNYLYDSNSARLCLDAHIQSTAQREGEAPILGTVDLQNYSVQPFDQPPTLRLVKGGEGQILEEAVFAVPGIICSKVLPPVYGPIRSTDDEHVRRLRQFVRLTGLGSLSFGAMARATEGVATLFEMATGPGKLNGLHNGQYEGHCGIDMHNRHFTDRRLAGSEPPVPFTPDIDPNQALDEARGTRFVRIQDNVVQYSALRTRDDGTVFHEQLDPVNFKEGDIVVANGAFVAHPMGGGPGFDGQHQLVFTLRSLTMLTSQYREDSKIKRREEQGNKPEGRQRPKRGRHPSTRDLKRHVIHFDSPSN